MDYNPQKIEKKWQKAWKKTKTFRASDKSQTRAKRSVKKRFISSQRPNFYVLDMFPYPSAEGIHTGHLRGYTFSDIIAKKKKMQGFNVLHPMGWDAFGLPAENYAIKRGIHPAVSTKKAIKNIKQQLISVGFGYDWQREICSCDPDYYKWTQWLFLQFYKAGLAYRKEAKVNFCPSCKTVLANEQVIKETSSLLNASPHCRSTCVIEGKCERCDSLVEKKYLKQWFFKITKYADRLLSDLSQVDWPENIKTMQKNWIGRSEGTDIDFKIEKSDDKIRVFTTRVDTLFGCTYLVLAPEHPIITNYKLQITNYKDVKNYIEEAKKKTEIERTSEDKEKTGIELKGIKAINPVNNQEVPIFVADYVLWEYGTGAVMAVPSHDQRDFEFAKKYGLEIREVIAGGDISKQAFVDYGRLINSGQFNGLSSKEAIKKITNLLKKKNLGRKTIQYKLRDWLISRQRYWGTPIPIIYCSKCGEVPVLEKDLPIKLPNIKDFKPSGQGKSPLAKSKKFVEIKCPRCKGSAQRETDTLDTFVCSSWYFLRYTDARNKKEFANKQKVKKWLPVDLYIGGVEHAVLHLLYARFFTKTLKDLGYLDFNEPFTKLFNQGMIYYQGAKMSKSKGNVVSPDEIIQRYGADTMRLYECFMGPADQAVEWSDKGIAGCYRFLNKTWNLKSKAQANKVSAVREKNVKHSLRVKIQNLKLKKLIHQTIKKVTGDIEDFKFNTAISSLMILVNEMEKEKEILVNDYLLLIALLAPFAPHFAEEVWKKLGNSRSIFEEKWPKYDSKLIKEEMITLIIQVNGRVRDKIEVETDISEEKAKKLVLLRKKVQKWIKGKKVKKIIFVPGKLINIVV